MRLSRDIYETGFQPSFVYVHSFFVIAPPLIISREEIDEGVRALDESLHLADRKVESL